MNGSGFSNFLITGRPGIGKTTVIDRLAQLLGDRCLAGFVTREVREAGRRQGFEAVTFAGQSCMLADERLSGTRYRVGRYGVDVTAFEQLVLPELQRPCDLMLIDEIGKMECFSTRVVEAIRALLDSNLTVVATVAAKGSGFIIEARNRPDARLFQVTAANRDQLPQHLSRLLP